MTMLELLNKVYSENTFTKYQIYPIKAFIAAYASKNIDEVNWIELCNDAKKYECTQFVLLLICELLREGLYHGDYAKELLNNLEFYDRLVHDPDTRYADFLCGSDITRQIIYSPYGTRTLRAYRYRYVNTTNGFFRSILAEFFSTPHFQNIHCAFEPVEVFEESLGPYRDNIHSISSFSSKLLFVQSNFYRKMYANDGKLRQMALTLVVHFYRWLVLKYPEYALFEDCTEMSTYMLFHKDIMSFLDEGYHFTTLNPANIPYGKDKICFLLRGVANQSTRLIEGDYASLNLSALTENFYRDLLIEFAVLRLYVHHIGTINTICKGMQTIYEMKQHPHYPNKRLDYLSTQEAVFIRQYYDRQELSLSTKNDRIGAMRRFIAFCVDKKALKVDRLFFDYLIQYDEPNQNKSKAVPDDALVAIHNALLEKSKNDLFYQEMLVIFHLAIQTEFRISQICHLKIDCIKPTFKPNEFEIHTSSKTSNGVKERYTISTISYRLLMGVIDATESLREENCINNLRDYIFIYPSKMKPGGAAVFYDSVFSKALKNLCAEIDVAPYTAANLRDTHMTKSLEHIIRNGKSDMEMGVLSRHRHIDTTTSHYIDLELEKMLEATYGIVIGSELIETDSKVVDTIPDHLVGQENDVEDGCGKCSAEKCMMTNALPCIACKYFITTVGHEIYFRKAIDALSLLIKQAKSPHDQEDLVTVKRLYVHYLKAILKHKEGMGNG